MTRIVAAMLLAAALMRPEARGQVPLPPADPPGVKVIDQPPPVADDPLTFHDVVMIGPVGRNQRTLLAPDPVVAGLIRGDWKAPKPGDVVKLADGTTRTWEAGVIEPKVWLKSPLLDGGYVYIPFTADERATMVLATYGAADVYVNGEPHVGDRYQTGWTRLPIVVKPGKNFLLVKGAHEELRIQMQFPFAPVFIDPLDPTLPDIVEGQTDPLDASVIVVNATEEWQKDLMVVASLPGGEPIRADLEPLAPATARKVPFQFEIPSGLTGSTVRLTANLVHASGKGPSNMAAFNLRIRKPEESRRVTFRSRIDGSVQYYAVRPAVAGGGTKPGMIFTLHGASVEATGQVDAYASKPWATIVAPTNRRPYGFDWEDMGRLDFLEVYRDAVARYQPDPAHIWLTGHSMGGHGTWQIGAQYPALFGAIAPSAGWVDFRLYSGAAAYDGGSPIEGILRRSWGPSDTLALKGNYRNLGVYVLHGDADDNVPVAQARRMKEEVGKGHPDFVYEERPGAGHWWGNECVDWPPLMEFLRKHTVPNRLELRHTAFTTVSPGVSNSPCGWASVEAQIEPLKPSSVDLSVDPGARSFTGTTQNVAGLELMLGMLTPAEAPIHLKLDGQSLDVPAAQGKTTVLALARDKGTWGVAGTPAGPIKSPARSGLFKDIFRNGVVFVVGTGGTQEESAWAMSKARFDAESLWYRGNGSVRIVLDKDFFPPAYQDRNVLLYGNAATNSAWAGLLPDSPISVGEGKAAVGGKEFTGGDLACLFIRPRPGSETACVAAVSGTGAVGMRMAGRVPYFQSGVGVPDWLIFGVDAMETGVGGIRAAGFFDNGWGFSASDSAWRDQAAH